MDPAKELQVLDRMLDRVLEDIRFTKENGGNLKDLNCELARNRMRHGDIITQLKVDFTNTLVEIGE